MRVDLQAKVLSRDGEEVGTIGRAIFDPRRDRVTHVVVNTGWLFGRDVLVPAPELERALPGDGAVQLELTKDEFESLPTYAPTQYLPPPPGWTPPATYGLAYEGFLWPTMYPTPAAAGYGYAGAGAGVGTGPDELRQPTIAHGDTVADRDGEDLGLIEEVMVDAESGRVRGVALRIGNALQTLLGGGPRVEVNGDAIERVEDGRVYLNLRQDELRQVIL